MKYTHLTIRLGFIFLLVLGGTLPAHGLVLEEEAEVEMPPFTLEDIARDVPDERMASIRLGELPKPGQSRFISQAYIRMQARLQDKPVPSFDGGVNQVTIHRPSRTLSPEKVRDQVKSLLKDEFSVSETVEVEILEILSSVEILSGPYKLQLDGWNPYRARRGTSWYRIGVHQRGSETLKFRVKGSIKQNGRVPVASKPIARGQKITSDLITWEERDISRLKGNIVNREKQVIGFKSTQRYKPGDVITGDGLEKPIVVQRRSPVTIVHKINGLTITTRGIAQEKGARGDLIMVKNRSSEVQLQAEVINKRRVLITNE